MITKEQAVSLKSGTIVFHVDVVGVYAPHKVRKLKITSKCRTWVRRPEDWLLPYKFGLYAFGTIGLSVGSGSLNPANIYLTEQEAEEVLMLHNIQSKLKG